MSVQTDIEAGLAALRGEHRYRELRREEGVSFSHNDYLGLARHPAIVEAGVRTLAEAGAGSRGSRLLGGHTGWHEEVEARIAGFFRAPAALFFSTGYLANLAVLQAIAPFVDAFVSDERNHASLIDGLRLAGKTKAVVPHQRWDGIPAELEGRRLALVAESLYSMDGDLVDAEALRAAAAERDAFLVLDESHAGGVFFEDGRGAASHGRDWAKSAVVVTFGKAFGVAGAAVLGSRALRDWLINCGRPFLFSTAPPPAVAAMVTAALDVADRESWRRTELWSRAESVRRILRAGTGEDGPVLRARSRWDERSPVIPFLVPGDDRALRLSESMQNSGWQLRAIRSPTVARGTERLRISISLAADREATERMASDLVRLWQR